MKKVIDFMEENMGGRTLFMKELVYELENGALQDVYPGQISFSNLKCSQSGFQTDIFIASNEKIWLIGKGRQRDKLRRDFSSVPMFRFELAMRRSTNAITGRFRLISASGKNMPTEAVVSGIYDIRLKNSVLELSESQILYRDQPMQDECYEPVTFQMEHRFCCRDGKLHYEYDGRCFNVNTNTMQRHGSSSTFPPFISIER